MIIIYSCMKLYQTFSKIRLFTTFCKRFLNVIKDGDIADLIQTFCERLLRGRCSGPEENVL